MIYPEKPANFMPEFEVVGCLCETDQNILLLYRLPHKSQGNRWGMPAGKINQGETKEAAVIREIKEETGLKVNPASLEYIDKLYVKHGETEFIYHMFHTTVAPNETITINPAEHSAYKWVTVQESLTMPYVEDFDACLKRFYPDLQYN